MKRDDSMENLAPWLSEESDASSNLRAFLREASANPQDAARIERLRQRLGPWLAATSPPPAAPPASGSGAGATVGAGGKAGLWAIGAGTLISGTLWLVVGPSGHEPVGSHAASGERASPRRSVSPPAALAPPALDAALPATVPSHAPAAPPESAEGKPARSVSGPRSPEPSLAEEAAALAVAQRVLASSPSRSLALLQQHARTFPRSALAEERWLFTIEALAALSRPDEARRELARFEVSYPRSAHLGKAKRVVGIEVPTQ